MEYKKQTNRINGQTKPNKNKHVDTENRVVVIRGEGTKGRAKWIKGINCMAMDGN